MIFQKILLISFVYFPIFGLTRGIVEECKKNDGKEEEEKAVNILDSFGSCEVDDTRFTDFQNVDLKSFALKWNEHLKIDKVPSLTNECKGQAAVGCERAPIDLTATYKNSTKPRQIIIDTDFENEVDDYLAVTWALLSFAGPSSKAKIVSIIAAPFSFRHRFLPYVQAKKIYLEDEKNGFDSLKKQPRVFLYGYPGKGVGGQITSLLRFKDIGITPESMIEKDNHATWCPDRGMEESYQGLKEFLKLFKKAKRAGISPAVASVANTTVFRGQSKYVTGTDPLNLIASDGVQDLIYRARKASVEEPLYVVCIAAPTNVASALLIAPDIVGKLVVLWDASWSLKNRGRVVSGSLNLGEDLVASRIMLESGVRMLYFPGFPSGQTLQLSFPEMEAWYKGRGPVSDAIYNRFNNNPDAQFTGLGYGRYRSIGTTRVMWDIGNFMPFILPNLLSVTAVPAARLQRVETVPNTCKGYESIGTGCMAYYPTVSNGEKKETYPCKEIDQYDTTRCNDAFFVDAPKFNDTFLDERSQLVEASMLGGLSGPGGSGINLLQKLAEVGL